MFKDNLVSLRKIKGISQEELAEKVNISRQTLSKYEKGESVPDINICKKMAEFFDVSVDDLISYTPESGLNVPPKGKHIFGMVKVGDKGQISIPVKARKVFDIHPGDSLIVLGDECQGIAIISEKQFSDTVNELRKGV